MQADAAGHLPGRNRRIYPPLQGCPSGHHFHCAGDYGELRPHLRRRCLLYLHHRRHHRTVRSLHPVHRLCVPLRPQAAPVLRRVHHAGHGYGQHEVQQTPAHPAGRTGRRYPVYPVLLLRSQDRLLVSAPPSRCIHLGRRLHGTVPWCKGREKPSAERTRS